VSAFDVMECDNGQVDDNVHVSSYAYTETRNVLVNYRRYVFINEVMRVVQALMTDCSGSFMCSDTLPRQQLSAFLLHFATSIAALDTTTSANLLAVKASTLSDKLLQMTVDLKKQTRKDTSPPLSPPLLPYTYYSITVVIFVPEADVIFAQNYVQSVWRQKCPMCSVVMNVVVLTMDRSFAYTGNPGRSEYQFDLEVDIDSDLRGEDKVYTEAMRLRYVYMVLRKYIQQSVVASDIVAVLFGIEALLAMHSPGGNGVIPHIELGEFGYFNVGHASITFASAVHSSDTGVGDGGGKGGAAAVVADMRAFVGIAGDVLSMLNDVLSDPLTLFADSSGLSHVLYSYIESHPLIIGVDISQQLFDFCLVNRNNNGIMVDSGGGFHELRHFKQSFNQSPRQNKLYVDMRAFDEFAAYSSAYADAVNKVLYQHVTKNDYDRCPRMIAEALERTAAPISHIFIGYIHTLVKLSLYYVSDGSIADRYAALETCSDLITQLRQREGVTTDDDLQKKFKHFRQALHSLMENLYYHLGLVAYGIRRFEVQVPAVNYEEVSSARMRWRMDRESGLGDVRLMTYANKPDSGLDMLLASARWSDINIKVVGMGEDAGPRFNFSMKFVAYLREIAAALSTGEWKENDVIVLMDAFDVLVFPPLTRINKVLEMSPTPIIACSEHGIHIDKSSPYFYPRGLKSSYDEQKFLNSGCLAGRLGQMKEFLDASLAEMEVMSDDQKMAIWRHIRHPELLSLGESALSSSRREASHDVRSSFTTLECMYKEDITRFAIRRGRGSGSGERGRGVDERKYLYVDGQQSSVGLVHFNGGALTHQYMHGLLYVMNQEDATSA